VYDAIYPWVTGGAERRFAELGRRLATQHDVHLVGWQWWDGPARIRRDGMTLHGLGRGPALYGDDGKRTVREALAFSARLLPFLLRHRFDVIDCSATPYLPLYAAALGRRARGGRLVVTWHEYWDGHWDAYLPHRPMVARVARALESGGRRLGDRVVAVSDFTARAMGMTEDPRLEVIGNGVDVAAIDSAVPADARSDLLFMGRLIDEKRVDLLLDALALLADRNPPPQATIVGDGPELPALQARAADLGLAGRVRFTGRVPDADVPRHLRAASVLVMPSQREGYGMAVAEAQAAGVVPVVVRSPFSAAPDLVHDGVDGVLVEPTAAALAEAIGALLDDRRRLSRLAAAARVSGAARDWDEVALRMHHMYTSEPAEDPAAEPAKELRWS
ncbi:MAG: glycosyltransferase family 4 protein, partial [Actinomycetota bacterium]|nr:glycosyltransferase family 4 protein [Actinomycetota bacterium]